MTARPFMLYYRNLHQNVHTKSFITRHFHYRYVTKPDKILPKAETVLSQKQHIFMLNLNHQIFHQIGCPWYTNNFLRNCCRQFHYGASVSSWDPVSKKFTFSQLDDNEVPAVSRDTSSQTEKKDVFSFHGDNKSFIIISNEEEILSKNYSDGSDSAPCGSHSNSTSSRLEFNEPNQPLQSALGVDAGSNQKISSSHGNRGSNDDSNINMSQLHLNLSKDRSCKEYNDGDRDVSTDLTISKEMVGQIPESDLPSWNNHNSTDPSKLSIAEISVTSDSLETVSPNKDQMGILSHSETEDELEIHGTDIFPLERKQKTKQLPVHNLAAIVDKSPTLAELGKLGVNFSELEKVDGAADLIAKLDFEKDIRPHLLFLLDVGIPEDKLGHYLSKNPLVLEKDIAELQVKIRYLESKRFSSDAIARIVSKCYVFLVMPITMVDAKLGFLQKRFRLTGDEVRSVVTRQPKLIAWKTDRLKDTIFYIKEFLGFSELEMKKMLLAQPKVFLTNKFSLAKKFDFLHNVMMLNHDRLVQWPNIFRTRLHLLQQRHRYLDSVGRAQYDPERENYVSLKALVGSKEKEFCQTLAKTSVAHFHDFLKTQ